MNRFRILVLLAVVPTLGGCDHFWQCVNGWVNTSYPSPPVRTAPVPRVGAGPAEPAGPAELAEPAELVGLAELVGSAELAAPAEPAEGAVPLAFAQSTAFAPEDATLFPVRQERQAPYRDPQRAFCFACMLAGGGHFYTGETTKGAALLGIAAAGLIGGVVLSDGGSDDPFDCEYDFETHECEPEANRMPLLVGAGIAAASWAYGIIDSRKSADRVNARNGHQVGTTVEMRPMLGFDRGKPGGGVSFRVTW